MPSDLSRYAHSTTGNIGQVIYKRTYPAGVQSWLGQVIYNRTYPAEVKSWLGQVSAGKSSTYTKIAVAVAVVAVIAYAVTR